MRQALLLTLVAAAGLGTWALLRRPADHALDAAKDREPATSGGRGDLMTGRTSEAGSTPPGRPRLGGPTKAAEARGGTLVGRVLRPGGLPAPGALVRARSDAAPAPPAVETRTDPDGSFRLVGLPAGLLRVRASLTGEIPPLETMAFATADTDELELRLVPRVWELRVRVVDSLGALVPAFRCRVLTSEAVRLAGGKAGMAVLRLGADWSHRGTIDPAEQPTFVEVWDARDGEGRALEALPARVGPIEAQGEELRVSLPAGRALRGRLLRADGTFVEGATVTVRVVPGGMVVPGELPVAPGDIPLGGIALDLTTNSQGRFDCTRLSQTKAHRVEVRAVGVDLLPLEVVVGPAEDIGDLHLRAARTVEIRVLHADGTPQSGVLVWALPESHDTVLAARVRELRWAIHTDSRGVAVLEGLDPEARYDLEVVPPREDDVPRFELTPEEKESLREIRKAVGLGRLRLPGWRPRSEVVRLPVARPLDGLVEDEAGQPVGSAFVEVRDLEGWRWVVRADADGGFRLTQPPAGPLLVACALQEDALGRGASVRVEEEARGGVRLSVALAGSVLVIVRGDREGALREWHENDIFAPRADDPVMLQLGGQGWSAVPAAVVVLNTPGDEQHAAEVAGDAVRCYRIVGLRSGARHAFWQYLGSDGHLYGEIPPGARVLRLRQEPGESIQVRVLGVAPDGVVEIAASDTLGRVVSEHVSLEGGEATVEGLPRGAWDVLVSATLPGGRLAVRSASAQTGSAIELDLAAPIR